MGGPKLDSIVSHSSGDLHAILANVVHRNYLTRLTKTTTGVDISTAARGKGRLRWLTVPDEGWSVERAIMSRLPAGVSKRVEEVVGMEHLMDRAQLRGLRQTATRLTTEHEPAIFSTCRATGQQIFPSRKAPLEKLFSPERGFDMVWLSFSSPPSDGMLGDLSIMAENVGVFERAWKCGRPGLLVITLPMGTDMKSFMRTMDWIQSDQVPSDDDSSDSFRLSASELTRFLNEGTFPLGFSCLPLHSMLYCENLPLKPASTRCFLCYEIWKGRYNFEPKYTRILKQEPA